MAYFRALQLTQMIMFYLKGKVVNTEKVVNARLNKRIIFGLKFFVFFISNYFKKKKKSFTENISDYDYKIFPFDLFLIFNEMFEKSIFWCVLFMFLNENRRRLY